MFRASCIVRFCGRHNVAVSLCKSYVFRHSCLQFAGIAGNLLHHPAMDSTFSAGNSSIELWSTSIDVAFCLTKSETFWSSQELAKKYSHSIHIQRNVNPNKNVGPQSRVSPVTSLFLGGANARWAVYHPLSFFRSLALWTCYLATTREFFVLTRLAARTYRDRNPIFKVRIRHYMVKK